MGLDMYLNASKFAGNWNHTEDSERNLYLGWLKSVGLDPVQGASATLEVTVMKWRKANQIHAWFVENCADGKDECQEIYVDRDKLTELAEVCEMVLADHTKAGELLPPQAGCFFGGTEIDEDYFDDIRETAEELRKILNNPKLQDWDFQYQASW